MGARIWGPSLKIVNVEKNYKIALRCTFESDLANKITLQMFLFRFTWDVCWRRSILRVYTSSTYDVSALCKGTPSETWTPSLSTRIPPPPGKNSVAAHGSRDQWIRAAIDFAHGSVRLWSVYREIRWLTDRRSEYSPNIFALDPHILMSSGG